MISATSYSVQSSRKILFGKDGGINSLNEPVESLLEVSSISLSFSFDAMEAKYSLNLLAITLRCMTTTPSIIKFGFTDLLLLPLNWFITSHVFFRSPEQFEILFL